MGLRKVLLSLLVIGVIGGASVAFSSSFFSDTETSSSNTFTAGRLDLKVNGGDNPNAIVNINDLKPGDPQIVHKTLYIDNNPAFVWLHLKDLVASQGAQTTPETIEESSPLGPKWDIQNYMNYDLVVADKTIISDSDQVRLPDAVSCWIPLGELPGAKEIVMDQSFHFDAGVTNWAQGDNLIFTEEFFAVQSRNNPNASPPDIGTGRIWNPDLKKCISDSSAKHNLIYTCVTGCSGTYPHTINITSGNISSGSFSGTGFYNTNPAYTWNVTGNTTGGSFSAHTVYTGLNPGYFTDLTGTVDGSGNVTGTALSSTGQTFTFAIN